MPAILFMHLPYCRQSLHRALAISYFSLLWALLFYTFGRAALFAQIGCLLLIPALFGRKGVHWTGLQLIAGLGGLALLFLAFGINPFDPGSPTSRLVSLDDEARLALWATSIDLISRHPLIGIGPMQFAAIPGVPNAHPHNLPLQIAVEWGIPAALLLGGTLVWSGWKWIAFARRRASDTDCPRWEAFLLMSLTASIAAATATSLVAGTAHTPMSQLMLIIVVGTAYALYRRNHPADVGKWRRLVAIWLCAILFATIWLAGFTTYELLHYLENDLQGTEHVGGGWIPRFWRVGKLTPSWEGS
jgi:O-antigen ligase